MKEPTELEEGTVFGTEERATRFLRRMMVLFTLVVGGVALAVVVLVLNVANARTLDRIDTAVSELVIELEERIDELEEFIVAAGLTVPPDVDDPQPRPTPPRRGSPPPGASPGEPATEPTRQDDGGRDDGGGGKNGDGKPPPGEDPPPPDPPEPECDGIEIPGVGCVDPPLAEVARRVHARSR